MPNQQERDGGWGYPEERAFIENLLCQRFNFLLVFFGLVVAGALECKERPVELQMVLWLGTVIVSLLSVTIAALQFKLGKILEEIFRDENQPITKIHRACHSRSVKEIIGYVIPSLCSLSLFVWALQASFNVFKSIGCVLKFICCG